MTTKDPHFGEEINCPAFGSILANRVSGDRDLYGSDVRTGGYVTIEIHEATQYDDAYCDRHSVGVRSLIKVAMSEAQWVGFISRMNIGSGTKCTLDFRPAPGVEMISPQLPAVEKAKERMERRILQLREAAAERINTYRDKIMAAAAAKLGKKEMDQFRINMECLVDQLFLNLVYGQTVLTEHKERVVSDAMVEIDAALKSYVHRVGLDTLKLAMNGTPPVDSKALDGPNPEVSE